jgi:hypothetical protein
MVEMAMLVVPLDPVNKMTCLPNFVLTTNTEDAVYFHIFKPRSFLACQRRLEIFLVGNLISLLLWRTAPWCCG